MPLLRAVPVMLSARERRTLKKRVRGAKMPWRDRLRAQIVLAAAMGRSNARIARDLGISQDTVRKWRGRFAARGLDGLRDRELASSPVSASSVLRILAEHPDWPWQCQSWSYPRDPDFEAKAKVILDLYQGFYRDEPLGPDDRILSFDAKPQRWFRWWQPIES
jgi:transposase-like protein